jgi:N-acetylmuramoyl-L-alanine amidase CwlA
MEVPVKYAGMDFVVTVSRKAHEDAELIARHLEAMRDALKHLSIIGERCDVRATARKGLGE